MRSRTQGGRAQSDIGETGATGATGATGPGYRATSTTSLAVGTGSKTATTQAGLAYTVGARVRLSSEGTPASWMEGLVTAYSSTTLVFTSDLIGTAGTHADWNINLAGEQGEAGDGGGGTVTADAPLAGDGSSGSHLSIPPGTNDADGYLVKEDHAAFAGEPAARDTAIRNAVAASRDPNRKAFVRYALDTNADDGSGHVRIDVDGTTVRVQAIGDDAVDNTASLAAIKVGQVIEVGVSQVGTPYYCGRITGITRFTPEGWSEEFVFATTPVDGANVPEILTGSEGYDEVDAYVFVGEPDDSPVRRFTLNLGSETPAIGNAYSDLSGEVVLSRADTFGANASHIGDALLGAAQNGYGKLTLYNLSRAGYLVLELNDWDYGYGSQWYYGAMTRNGGFNDGDAVLAIYDPGRAPGISRVSDSNNDLGGRRLVNAGDPVGAQDYDTKAARDAAILAAPTFTATAPGKAPPPNPGSIDPAVISAALFAGTRCVGDVVGRFDAASSGDPPANGAVVFSVVDGKLRAVFSLLTHDQGSRPANPWAYWPWIGSTLYFFCPATGTTLEFPVTDGSPSNTDDPDWPIFYFEASSLSSNPFSDADLLTVYESVGSNAPVASQTVYIGDNANADHSMQGDGTYRDVRPFVPPSKFGNRFTFRAAPSVAGEIGIVNAMGETDLRIFGNDLDGRPVAPITYDSTGGPTFLVFFCPASGGACCVRATVVSPDISGSPPPLTIVADLLPDAVPFGDGEVVVMFAIPGAGKLATATAAGLMSAAQCAKLDGL